MKFIKYVTAYIQCNIKPINGLTFTNTQNVVYYGSQPSWSSVHICFYIKILQIPIILKPRLDIKRIFKTNRVLKPFLYMVTTISIFFQEDEITLVISCYIYIYTII